MPSPRYPVSELCSLGSTSAHQSFVFGFWSHPHFYPVRDQALGSTSLLSFISDVAVFPDPLFLRDCGFDRFCSSAGGSHRALPGADCTQERSQDRAAANAQRLLLGAIPPQKKFTQSCSSSFSAIMENHNTHLAPGFILKDLVPTPANVVVLQGPLGPLPGAVSHSLYQMSSHQGNCLSHVA